MSASSAGRTLRSASSLAAGFSAVRWEFPDWWLWTLSAAAWVVLFVENLTPEPFVHDDHSVMIMDSASEVRVRFVAGVVSWTVMVVAMMLPLSTRHARWLAHRSLARRRTRTILLHAAAYLGIWVLLGVVLAVVLPLIVSGVGASRTFAVVALLVAALWQVAPARRRMLRRCGAGRAPAVRGWRADLDCLRAGARTAGRCVATCGPAMAAVIAMHGLAIMVALTVIIANERRPGPNPEEQAGRGLEAIGLAAIAAGVWVLGSG